MERVRARPLPDLSTLAARVEAREDGAFLDLLKLREAGGPDAIPALAEILRAHRGKTDIFGHAAAQALFHVGGADADAALREFFAAGDVSSDALYAFAWEMAQEERDRFLAECVLNTTNPSLAATLTADRATVRPGEAVAFTLRVTNVGHEPALLYIDEHEVDVPLFLRDDAGHIAWPRRGATKCWMPAHHWLTLAPGSTTEFRFKRSFPKGTVGTYEVLGVFHRRSWPKLLPPPPPAPPWTGRVVCAPIPLTIGE